MSKIAILGSGPSLNLFFQTKVDYSCVIGCNSVLMEHWFLKLKNSVYAAHEKRILNKLWYANLVKYSGKKYIADPLYSKIVDASKPNTISGFIYLNKLLTEQPTTARYIKSFSEFVDLKKNVVLDFCIPLAVSLKASNIDLYGCDFSYGNGNLPNYFHKNGTIGSYEHSVESRVQWEQASNIRFGNIKDYLSNFGIKIQRII